MRDVRRQRRQISPIPGTESQHVSERALVSDIAEKRSLIESVVLIPRRLLVMSVKFVVRLGLVLKPKADVVYVKVVTIERGPAEIGFRRRRCQRPTDGRPDSSDGGAGSA